MDVKENIGLDYFKEAHGTIDVDMIRGYCVVLLPIMVHGGNPYWEI